MRDLRDVALAGESTTLAVLTERDQLPESASAIGRHRVFDCPVGLDSASHFIENVFSPERTGVVALAGRDTDPGPTAQHPSTDAQIASYRRTAKGTALRITGQE